MRSDNVTKGVQQAPHRSLMNALGSYKPNFVSFKLAEDSIPIEPVTMLASSERISPNIFSVRITSNCAGSLTSCIAQLSTSI